MAWFDDLNAMPDIGTVRRFQPKKKPEKKKGGRGGTLTSLISEGGAIGGGAAGAAAGTALLPGLGTLIGGGIGAGIGAFTGRVAENKIRDDRLGVGDAAKEGALSTVLGAGPIRLAKGAVTAGKAVKGGSGLTDALIEAGNKATKGSIRETAGKKLTNASDDLSIRGFRLKPSQLTNFKNKFGEDVSQVIKKYKLTGKDSDTIRQTVIDPLQSEFDAIGAKIPAIPTANIQKAFEAKYGKLISSAVEDNKSIGRQLKQQADEIAKKYGDTVDGAEIATLRREFDSLVSYADKAANPARYGVNKRAADALRSVLQDTADKVGLKATDGKTFKEVGRELSKLRQLTDDIGGQENLGRGSSPLGITTLLGGGVGAMGGPAGAISGILATRAVNSPGGRKAVAGATEKAGAALTAKGAVAQPYGAPAMAGRILPVAGTGAYLSSNTPNSASSPTTPPATSPNSIADNIGTLSQETDSLSSDNSPFAPQNLQASIQKIIANGGSLKDASEFISLAQALQSIQESGQASAKPLSAEASKVVSNANIGLQALDDFEGAIAEDPSVLAKRVIPGRGAAGGLLGGILGTRGADAAAAQIVDVIARLRTGAAITNDEAKRFETFIPQANDPPQVRSQKLSYLRDQFTAVATRSTGSGTDLESALISAQGGY